MSDEVETLVIKLEADDRASPEIKAALEEIKAETDSLGRKKIKLNIDADTKDAAAKIALLRAEMDRLNDTEKEQVAEHDRLKTATGNLASAEKNAAADAVSATRARKAAIDQEIASEKSRQTQLKALQSVVASQIAQDTAQAASTRKNVDADLERAKSLAQVTRMQQQYLATQQRANDLAKTASKLQGSDQIRANVDTAAAEAQMEELRLKLTAMGRDPIDIDTRINRSDEQEAVGVLGKIKNALGFNYEDRAHQIENAFDGLGEALGKIGNARINFGPFTTSIAGFGAAAVALGPVITGIVGALGSLVSVVGAGLVGALGVGAAGMSGFAMAGAGIYAMLKPQITQFAAAHTAVAAYTTAVMKYGKNSSEAAAAQKTMNSTLASATPTVRSAMEDMTKMSLSWHKLTDPTATKDFGSILSSTMKTAGSDMTFFAHDSTSALNAVTGGWDKWMTQLRSPAAKSAMNNIFQNFNSSIPSIMSGLSSLGAAFGHIVSAFSNFLPGLSKGFASWAQGIDNATQNSGKLQSMVEKLVHSMQDVGHFAEAAGRFIASFFKAGIGPGNDFLNSMTSGLNKLTDQMNTTAGQTKLQNFFQRGIDTTKQLFSAIMPLISAFAQFSQAMKPVSAVALTVVEAIAKLAAILVGFKPLQYFVGFLAGVAILNRLTAGFLEAGNGALKLGKNLFTALSTMRDMGAVSAFKTAFSGASSAAPIEEAFTAGAATTETAIETGFEVGSSAAAARIEAAMAAGGAEAATEEAAGASTGGAAAGIESGIGTGAMAATKDVAPAAEEATGAVEDLGAAAVVTEGETGLLAGALSAGVPILAGVAAGALAVYAAIKLFGGSSDSLAREQDRLNKSWALNTAILRDNSSSLTSNLGTAEQLVSAHQDLGTSTQTVTKLTAELNKMQADGKTNTAAYKNGLSQLNAALQQQYQDQQTLSQGTKQYLAQDQNQIKLLQTSIPKAQSTQAAALANLTTAQRAYNRDVAAFGPTAAKNTQDYKNLQTAQNAYANATNNLTERQQQLVLAQERVVTENFNLARSAQNLSPVTTQLAQVGSLLQRLKSDGTTGASALNFLIKLPNPQDIVKITDLIDQLHGAAAGKAAINIVANASSATQAINQLNGLVLKQKVLTVEADVGNTLAKVAQVNGVTLSPKTLRLLHEGDPQVIAAVSHIQGMNLSPKILKLIGDATNATSAYDRVKAFQNLERELTLQGNPASALGAAAAVTTAAHAVPTFIQTVLSAVNNASGVIDGVIGALDRIPLSITSTITAITNDVTTHTTKATGGIVPAAMGVSNSDLGMGGLSSDPVLYMQQKMALKAAARRPTETAKRGGQYTKPVYLVGEENRPEYVIATNPAYRARNVGYLADAAREFGMRITPAAKGAAPAKPKTAPHATAPPAFNGLPAKDRIGGIGLSDIQTAVQAAQSSLHTATTKLNQDNSYIAKYKTAKSGTYEATEYANAVKARPADLKNETALTAKVNRLKAALAGAAKYDTMFNNLESAISTVGSYENAAATLIGAGKTGKAAEVTGFDYDVDNSGNVKIGAQKTEPWGYWHAKEVKMMAVHTNLLEAAASDAKQHFAKNATETQFAYVRALQQALGESIANQISEDTTTTPSFSADQTQVSLPSLDDVMQLWKAPDSPPYKTAAQEQAGLNYWEAVAQTMYDQAAPAAADGTPSASQVAGLAAEAKVAKEQMGFYTALLPTAAKWDKAYMPYGDSGFDFQTAIYQLIDSASQNYSQATAASTAASSTSTSTDPAAASQAQIADTERGSLYENFASNVGAAITAGSGSAAAAGAQVNPALQSTPTPSSTEYPSTGATSSNNYEINNHFSTPPPDAHSWSQALAWETSVMT